MIKLEKKLETLGFDYRIENRSQSKCDLTVSFKGINESQFISASESITKLAKIIIKEDIVLIKDGGVVEYPSIKDYLNHFRIHLEEVKLKRLKKDSVDMSDELEFLEAKLKFLNFMIQKKRNNSEISDFLKGYSSKISNRLQRIEAIKLSSETIEETKNQILILKKQISENKKLIKQQSDIFEKLRKEYSKVSKSFSRVSLFEPKQIDGIEVFQPEEEEIIEEQKEDSDEIITE